MFFSAVHPAGAWTGPGNFLFTAHDMSNRTPPPSVPAGRDAADRADWVAAFELQPTEQEAYDAYRCIFHDWVDKLLTVLRATARKFYTSPDGKGNIALVARILNPERIRTLLTHMEHLRVYIVLEAPTLTTRLGCDGLLVYHRDVKGVLINVTMHELRNRLHSAMEVAPSMHRLAGVDSEMTESGLVLTTGRYRLEFVLAIKHEGQGVFSLPRSPESGLSLEQDQLPWGFFELGKQHHGLQHLLRALVRLAAPVGVPNAALLILAYSHALRRGDDWARYDLEEHVAHCQRDARAYAGAAVDPFPCASDYDQVTQAQWGKVARALLVEAGGLRARLQ